MDGWVKLHRKLLDNQLWLCETFTRGQAWVDLVMLANYEESFFYKRGVKIDVLRGQVARSEVELSDRWHWSRTKVRKFLNDLEKEQQIRQQKTNITQLVTIINYEEYQKKEQQTGQQKNSRKTAKKHIKESKEEKESKEVYTFDEFWDDYDKKVGSKKDCEKKFNKLSDSVKLKIKETLPAFKKSIREKQYQPYPSSYLNQERWNDEIKKENNAFKNLLT